MKFNVLVLPILAAWAMPFLSGCSVVAGNGGGVPAASGAGTNASSVGSSTSSTGGSTATPVQSVSNPTADTIVGRIQLALPTVSTSAGNLKTAYAQIASNLPVTPNPNLSTGLEQIPILVFAACTDVNPTTYKVNTATSVTANQANLVAAGVTMVNANIGGLASDPAYASQTSAVFTQLVAADMTAGASTAATFVSVCLAANSFGVGMVGF